MVEKGWIGIGRSRGAGGSGSEWDLLPFGPNVWFGVRSTRRRIVSVEHQARTAYKESGKQFLFIKHEGNSLLFDDRIETSTFASAT